MKLHPSFFPLSSHLTFSFYTNRSSIVSPSFFTPYFSSFLPGSCSCVAISKYSKHGHKWMVFLSTICRGLVTRAATPMRPEFMSRCTCAREAQASLQIGPPLEPRRKIKVSDLYHRFEDEAQTCICSQGWRIQQGSLDRQAHRPHSVGESVFLWISSFSPEWNAGHCAFSLLRLLPPASEEKRGALSSFRLR